MQYFDYLRLAIAVSAYARASSDYTKTDLENDPLGTGVQFAVSGFCWTLGGLVVASLLPPIVNASVPIGMLYLAARSRKLI